MVPQADSLDPDFTVTENLGVFARYFGIPAAGGGYLRHFPFGLIRFLWHKRKIGAIRMMTRCWIDTWASIIGRWRASCVNRRRACSRVCCSTQLGPP